jgi:hypothetical protein
MKKIGKLRALKEKTIQEETSQNLVISHAAYQEAV